MERVVLDTNCLVQSIPYDSPYRMIWDKFRMGDLILCVSNDILLEYQEILGRLTSPNFALQIIATIVNNPHTAFLDPKFRFNLIKGDPDDNKFVDCAIIANAKCIVTNDHHFDEVKNCDFPKVDILSIDEFLKFIRR